MPTGHLFSQDAAESSTESSEADSPKVNPEELVLNQPANETEAASDQKPVISTWDFVRMLLILGVVVAVIYLLFILLKKGAKGKHQENELIRLLDYRTLSGNRALHLVEVGRIIYLVGSSENGVSLISEIEDKESLDMLRLSLSENPPETKRNFSDILSKLFKPEGGGTLTIKDSLNFMRNQKKRLKKL